MLFSPGADCSTPWALTDTFRSFLPSEVFYLGKQTEGAIRCGDYHMDLWWTPLWIVFHLHRYTLVVAPGIGWCIQSAFVIVYWHHFDLVQARLEGARKRALFEVQKLDIPLRKLLCGNFDYSDHSCSGLVVDLSVRCVRLLPELHGAWDVPVLLLGVVYLQA